MPVLKHAKKKLRQDKKRTTRNKELKDLFKKLVKQAREKKTPQNISKAFSVIDKAAKEHIIHKNKAARMKSALSKTIEGKTAAVTKPVEKKAVVKKSVVKKTASKKVKTAK